MLTTVTRACLTGAIIFAASSSASAQRSTPVQLLHPAAAADDQFSYAIAIDGDTAVVGARNDDVAGHSNQGSAHVFRHTGSGWTLEATLTAPDGAPGDTFGGAVAISQST